MGLSTAFHRDDGGHDEPGQDSPWSDWVAASHTFNFCSDDPLIDWLEAFGQSHGFMPDDADAGYDPRTDFRKFLIERAREFERVVCDYLAQGHQLVTICGGASDVRTRTAVDATWSAMSEGVEIIAQAALWNPQNRTYGAPDLLVRSDVLHELFPTDFSEEQSAQQANDLPLRNHYRIVDIKFTTLNLLKDGHAGGDHQKYMVQAWLYNEALGRLQGLTPAESFLLGRRWKDSKSRGISALERIARVDHEYHLKSLGADLRTYALTGLPLDSSGSFRGSRMAAHSHALRG